MCFFLFLANFFSFVHRPIFSSDFNSLKIAFSSFFLVRVYLVLVPVIKPTNKMTHFKKRILQFREHIAKGMCTKVFAYKIFVLFPMKILLLRRPQQRQCHHHSPAHKGSPRLLNICEQLTLSPPPLSPALLAAV